jgi:hypothetical protein
LGYGFGGSMSFALTSSSTSVILTYDPITIGQPINKNLRNIVFHDGTDIPMDRGKSGFSLDLTVIETNNYYDKAKWINTIMDNKESILISGLTDTNLNKYYRIGDFTFTQNPAESFYRYSLVLERMYEEI